MANASKFLALILRHKPERIRLKLDAGGWASVDELVANAQADGVKIDRQAVLDAVDDNDKKRYALSEDGQRIRAVQGHSIEVDLGLVPKVPPNTLFHGTATRFLESIMATGLEARGRQHVHLSSQWKTARAVGARHGNPVILLVDTAAMQTAGTDFYLSENGVWLTERVAPDYLTLHESPADFTGEEIASDD